MTKEKNYEIIKEANQMIQEEWRPIIGYEGLYEVSNLGRVKSLKYRQSNREQILQPRRNNKGYLRVLLCKENIQKNWLIHRLVATAFIENPNEKEVVNHIDENKENNRMDNLEWVTAKENANHGTRIIRQIETRKNNRQKAT